MRGRTAVRARGVGGSTTALPPRGSTDAGMVVVEAALVIPLLAAVAVALAWLVGIGSVSLSLGDAARAAARDIARGEIADLAVARAMQSVPGATASVETHGDSVVVIVRDDVRPPVPFLSGIPIHLSQQVSIPREWS